MGRKLRNFALVGIINAATVILAVVTYYAYGKLTFEGYFCGRFARVDAEIGWVNALVAALIQDRLLALGGLKGMPP